MNNSTSVTIKNEVLFMASIQLFSPPIEELFCFTINK